MFHLLADSWLRGHLVNTNDFGSLLWILDMSRQNGVVHVELPKAQRTEKGEPWLARLYLVEGHVVECHVHSRVDGRKLLSDGEAMHWLAQWGQRQLVWSLEVFTPRQTTPHSVLHPAPVGLLPPARTVVPLQQVSQLADLPPPAQYSSPPHRITQPIGLLPPASQVKPPQRIVQAEQGVIRSWPRKHRQTFALVDGKRSVGQIAAMLKQPPAFVEEIVNDLQSLGVIRR